MIVSEMLEPDEVKVSSPVLRGEGSRKASDLPDRVNESELSMKLRDP